MSASLLDAVKEAAGLLTVWGRPGAIIGGVAFISRVRPRFTDDIDLVVTVPADQLTAFLQLSARVGFVFSPEGEKGFLEAGLIPMKSPLGFDIDVMVADDAFLTEVVRRASPVDLGAVSVPVITAEDLLLMKLDANRHVDLDDAIAIKDALGPTLDRTYLDNQARLLGVQDRLESLLGQR